MKSEPTREQRILSFMDLAASLAGDVGHWSLDRADLVQVASVAAINAIDSYSAKSGLTLEKWVACRMRWALMNAVKKAASDTRLREDADLSTLTSN